ncbi:MAG TPA: UDP-3-O-(3-hydroxymyristoyl)glucosamine N-acyltransferase [Caulobacteraceae bacterium]|nr:UDP-3-O-(3-hydroxymyristoyl)glucosamine N-acyltransferase [Caulobacteraceae bacterium]
MSGALADGPVFPDRRFYETTGRVPLGELAALIGATLADPSWGERPIATVAALAMAGPDALSFCSGREHLADLSSTAAAAVFLPQSMAAAAPPGCAVAVTPLPQAAMAAAAERLIRPRRHVADQPAIHPSAELEPGVTLGPGVMVGDGAQIGRGTWIGPGTVIGPGVAIGRDGWIGARAVIGFALIGDRVRIHAGAVIGEPGFGAAPGPGGIVDLPQLGRVILQDGVTVGANACIDRGAFQDTVVGENTKIDNLVQVAHNVVIGRNCLLAAYTGISGSTVVEDGCVFGGRAGISDHIVIGRGARIAAAAGVMKNVPAGESWGGSPARPVKLWLRETALLARLARRRTGEL